MLRVGHLYIYTVYLRYFGREVTKYTVIYGAYIPHDSGQPYKCYKDIVEVWTHPSHHSIKKFPPNSAIHVCNKHRSYLVRIMPRIIHMYAFVFVDTAIPYIRFKGVCNLRRAQKYYIPYCAWLFCE
jgi:hypothetical protein